MPAQILIRKLTKSQVEKAVTDQKAGDRLILKDEGGLMLLSAKQAYPADPIANAVLQAIADADSVLIMKEYEEIKAAEKAKTSS